jgi:hypothetical protein
VTRPCETEYAEVTPPRQTEHAEVTPPRQTKHVEVTPPRQTKHVEVTPPLLIARSERSERRGNPGAFERSSLVRRECPEPMRRDCRGRFAASQ